MDDVEIYQQARVRARRTATFRLRRQEQSLGAQARRRRLDAEELAWLAALRSELRTRTTREPGPPWGRDRPAVIARRRPA